MSTSDDRIPVPTNGHHALPAVVDEVAGTPAAASASDASDDELDAPKVIVTPGQATVVGFGILAGLILLFLGRRRGRNG